ncbi:MAG: pitrilysin family protein [Thermodesulfobacterium sp.]|nr:pitrilysin family protein [Thermodesulfobacterium sp.]
MNLEVGASESLLNKIIEREFSHGLKVLFYPYEREKVITVQLCIKVGSSYEEDSLAGITHLIEHMIFKGTETKKPEEIAGAIEAKGGYINAFTSYDYTCYYVAGPSEITETALEVLSTAVFNPYFDPQELEKEKEVVIEEMKMRLDNPFTVLFEKVLATSYQNYPYKRPIIGYEKTVRSLKRENLLSFVEEFYTPENMVLIIVGNFPPVELWNLVEKYFGKLPLRKLKKVSFPEEPYVSKPSLVWIERPVKESYFVFTFPGLSIKNDEAPLFDLLAEILGGGEASRLYLKLKRELNLVKSLSASAFTPSGPGLFEIYGTGKSENFKEILKVLLEELEKVKREGITHKELERAKIQVLSNFIFSQETSEGLAKTMGIFQLLRNSYKDILWYQEKVQNATPEDLKILAQRLFDYQKLVVGFLSEKKLWEEEELNKIIFSISPPSVEVFTLENGLKVIFYPIKDLPTVGITLAFPGGLRWEKPENNGLFQALSLLWNRGTKNFTAEELAENLESISATIKGFSGRNTFGLKGLFLSNYLQTGLEYFKEILLNPAFEEEECKKAKPELISALLVQEDQPLALALKEFLKELFPNHSYGLNLAGSYEFYQKLSCEELKKAYQKFVRPEKGVLVVVGDFDPFYLKLELKRLFKDWKPSSSETLKEESEPLPPHSKIKTVIKETHQTQILLGFQTPGLLSKEKIALEVLNYALSGQDGRLFRILRDEKSLAYAVTSFLVFYPKKSALVFYLACSPEKKDLAIKGFWEILKEISQKGLSEKEITRAKNRILGRYKLSLQSNLGKTEDMAVNEVLGLGWDYGKKFETLLKEVGQEDLKKLINDSLTEEKAFLLILGK